MFNGELMFVSESFAVEAQAYLKTLTGSDIVALRKELSEMMFGVDIRKEGNVAIVPITGMLTKEPNIMQLMFGGTSTKELTKTFRNLKADSDVKEVVLKIDSNGGSVRGVEVARRELKELANVKNVTAVADDRANSAAYYIGSAANKFVVTPSSSVGSIGVMAMFQDLSEDTNIEIIRAGKFKNVPSPFEGMDDEGRKIMQQKVDKFYHDFVNAISINRNISMSEAQEKADGSVKEGNEAIQFGLADEESTLEDVIAAAVEAAESEDHSTEEVITILANEFDTTYSALVESLETKLEASSDVLEELNTRLDGLEASATETAIEAKVDKAISEGRIGAARREHYVEKGKEKGADYLEDVFSNLRAGTVAPVNETVEEDRDVEANTEDPNAPTTDEEKRMMAQFPTLREKYDLHAYVK